MSVFFSSVLSKIYAGMAANKTNDSKILWRTLKLANALKAAQPRHNKYNDFFILELTKIDNIIISIFNSRSMDNPENVFRLMSNAIIHNTYENNICSRAMTLYDPVFKISLDLEITSIFGLPEVSQYIESIFRGNLKSKAPLDRSKLRQLQVVSQGFLRDTVSMFKVLMKARATENYQFLRYCPAINFFLEGVSKAAFLAIASWVSVYQYGESSQTEAGTRAETDGYSSPEIAIIVMFFGSILAEIGGFEGSTMYISNRIDDASGESSMINNFITTFYKNFFLDIWNFLDLCGLLCVGLWYVMSDVDVWMTIALNC